MATLNFSAARLPGHQLPRALLPADSIDSSQFDCTHLIDQHIIDNQMVEAMDTEIGRLLVEVGLATRTHNGRLNYHPEATNTMVVIAGDNGSYFSAARLSFDPERGKGTPYQTGVRLLLRDLPVPGPLRDGRGNLVRALAGRLAATDYRRVARSKTGRTPLENCATNQLELEYEFYTIDEAAPLPKLDR
jgi:hypothetical protein